MIGFEIDDAGLQALSRRLSGLFALAGAETDHEEDRRWWAEKLWPRVAEQAEGLRSKHLAGYAEIEERMGVGTEEGHERLRRRRSYTWRRSPRAGAVGGRVFRTVSVRSPAGSWWMPPTVTTRTRRWTVKSGATHSRTTLTPRPARDMKPALLAGRPWRVIPIRAEREPLAHAQAVQRFYAAQRWLRTAGRTPH